MTKAQRTQYLKSQIAIHKLEIALLEKRPDSLIALTKAQIALSILETKLRIQLKR